MASRLKVGPELETAAILAESRHPARIAGGRLKGSEIARDGSAWRVWTSRVRLARQLAQAHGLKLRALNGECEVWVPDALAESLLPRLGAKTGRQGRQASDSQLEALKRGRERIARLRFFGQNPGQNGTSGGMTASGGASAWGPMQTTQERRF